MVPTCFLNHGGGPLPVLGDPSQASLTTSLVNLQRTLDLRSTAMTALQAILVISAHWETQNEFQVLTAPEDGPAVPLYFDYYGFPKSTYNYTYKAPGAPHVAARVCNLLNNAGIRASATHDRQGFDHGVFIPLMLAFPDMDIPIVQLSLKAGLDPVEHMRAGNALSPLRDEGVLILGSGMSYHNMQSFMSDQNLNSKYGLHSAQFDNWLQNALSSNSVEERYRKLENWKTEAPYAGECHPREEHFAPIWVVTGSSRKEDEIVKILDDVCMGKKVTSFAFQNIRSQPSFQTQNASSLKPEL